ncbi:prokaryotic phospholipase A2-domain-containing protein [Diaporthe sp. PMI_573]|nr:prokaryotic phospholipase A2-domain-containing protein [Diaporthaceae sp. PMI_573]
MLSTAASVLPTAPVSAAPNTTALQQPIITPTTGHVNLGEEVPPGIQREEQADQYLFNITLESFISHRDQRYPSYFWWESDGCSQSPDAPFGFPFLPACYRHDFGYDQYKKQNRWTPAAKDKLDRNFRSEYISNLFPSYLIVDVTRFH